MWNKDNEITELAPTRPNESEGAHSLWNQWVAQLFYISAMQLANLDLAHSPVVNDLDFKSYFWCIEMSHCIKLDHFETKI